MAFLDLLSSVTFGRGPMEGTDSLSLSPPLQVGKVVSRHQSKPSDEEIQMLVVGSVGCDNRDIWTGSAVAGKKGPQEWPAL